MQWKQWIAVLLLCMASAIGLATPVADGIAVAAQNVRAQAGSHRLILIGEMHGTREIPDLVEVLVASYAAEGPVLLGLEMSRGEHATISHYLASSGDDAARAELRASAFWTVKNDQHDGRRSEDMLDLVESVRALRADGRDVAILPYDIEPDARVRAEQRDLAMAGRVRAAYTALAHGRLLVLAGNVHAMLQKPALAPPQMQTPMGSYLRDLAPYAVRIEANAGYFWACLAHCAPLPLIDNVMQDGTPDGIFQDSYHWQVVLPRLSVARLLGSSTRH